MGEDKFHKNQNLHRQGGPRRHCFSSTRLERKGKDRGESLISIASDGRVTDWAIKKGLEQAAMGWLMLKGCGGGLLKEVRIMPARSGAGLLCLALRPGGECSNLLRLKRVQGKGLSPPKGDALLARQSGGMCLDHTTLLEVLLTPIPVARLMVCAKKNNQNSFFKHFFL